MRKALYFDMDDTLYGLTDVPDWLNRLRANDSRVYRDGKPCHNMRKLCRYLRTIQNKGVHLGVISWLSMIYNERLFRETRIEKRRFLQKHMPSIVWDEIHLTAYGRSKSSVARYPNGLLVDDNPTIRANWVAHGGIAINPKDFTTEQLIEEIDNILALA